MRNGMEVVTVVNNSDKLYFLKRGKTKLDFESFEMFFHRSYNSDRVIYGDKAMPLEEKIKVLRYMFSCNEISIEHEENHPKRTITRYITYFD